MYAILVDLRFVGFLHQRVEAHADFGLAGGTDLMMVHFNFQTHGLHRPAHGGTQVRGRIDRWYREVTAFDARPVPEVAAFEVCARFPRRLFGTDRVGCATHLDAEFDVVENEEFALGSEECRVADTGRGQIGFGLLGYGTRVALVGLHIGRFDDVAAQVQRRFIAEGIEYRGIVIRHQDHV